MRGTENAYKLHRELGEIMTANVTVVRENDKLLETDQKIQELMKRYEDIDMEDTQTWSNQAVFFTRQLWNMLVLARVITIGAYNRNESRGAHYKPEFPDRNDDEWLKLQWLITKVELKTRIYLRASRCKFNPTT